MTLQDRFLPPHTRLPTLLFALASFASGLFLLHLQSNLTFRIDEWAFLLTRPHMGLSGILDPRYGHLLALNALLYWSFLHTFGMASPAPYQVASVFLYLLAMTVVFAWLRHRAGGWFALVVCAPVLVFGSASEDLLWSFQMAFFASMAFGVGSLLALDRARPFWDRVACLLLILSLRSSGLGVCFLPAVAVRLLFEPRRRQRAFIVGIPTALWGVWLLGWGRNANSRVTYENVLHAPTYLIKGLASSLAGLFGLVHTTLLVGLPPLPADLRAGPGLWGYLLLSAATVAFLGRGLRQGWPPLRDLLPALILLICYWLLVAAAAPLLYGAPTASRYQWMGAVFVLLVAAEFAGEMFAISQARSDWFALDLGLGDLPQRAPSRDGFT